MLSKKLTLKDKFLYLIVIILTLINISPLIWTALTSLKTRVEIFQIPPDWIPSSLYLDNLQTIIDTYGLELFNSFSVAFSSAILSLVIGVLAAYSLTKFEFWRQKDLEIWILSARMMPPIAAAIPLYITIRNVGLWDTRIGLIILYTAFNLPFVIWMLTAFFSKIPEEISEAAIVDGCSHLEVLTKITIPLSSSGIATVGIFSFLFSWNELLFALFMTSTRAQTFPVSLSAFQGQTHTEWELMAAGSIIQIIPVIIMIFLMQDYIISGLTMGAVKE